MRHPLGLSYVPALGLLAFLAGAGIADDPKRSEKPAPERPMNNGKDVMDNARLGMLLEKRLDKLEGKEGYWKAKAGKFDVLVITDEKHNRMRIMIPIQKIDKSDSKLLAKLLSANFDRALDVRYALYKGTLWAAFLHPLKSLTEDDLDSALKQVRTLAENTGTSYASSDLTFGAGDDDDEEKK